MKIEITIHAVDEYIERIAPNVGISQAYREIKLGVERHLFVLKYDSEHYLAGCLNLRDFPFVALLVSTKEGVRVISVGTTWMWHETRRYWTKLVGAAATRLGPSYIRKELMKRNDRA